MAVATEPRVEGDLTVIPVFEERLVVEKRLFLVEEVHIRRTRTTDAVSVPVELRQQSVTIEKNPISNPKKDESP